MTILLLFLVLFGLVHLVPVFPSLKARGQSLLGKAYGPVYGIVSLLLLGATVWAVRVAERAPLYDVPSWGAHANFGLSLVGFLCLGIFLCRGSWRNHLRYPMAIGILLWALGHLLANGDMATSLFFGGFAVIAILNAALKMAGGPFVPSDVRGGHNLLSIFVGLALYALMTQFHMALIGVPLVKLS